MSVRNSNRNGVLIYLYDSQQKIDSDQNKLGSTLCGYLHFECGQIDHCKSFGEAIAQNTFRVATTYLICWEQEIETFEYVIDDRCWARVEASFAELWHKDEEPNVHPNDTDELEQNFPDEIFAQIQCTIDDDENELYEQCDQKGHRNFVLLQIRLNATIALWSLHS